MDSFLKPTEDLTFNEIECLRRSGEPAWVAWTNKAIYDPSGRFTEHLIVGMDITERKEVENALHRVNANLNLVSSIARHDILNKLTVVNGSLSLLKNAISDKILLKYILNSETAMNAIKRQIEFTRDYKDMGMEKADWQDIALTIKEVLEDQDLRELPITRQLDNLEIFADPWLRRVFVNLLESLAHKETSPKSIQIYYSVSESGLSIFIKSDNGGIPADKKEKLFERSYDDSDDFGLFIAREILAITGISIRETGDPGKEILFEIAVPKRAYRFTKEIPMQKT
jgi:signal transduction histidine kinase